jgi:hypothetical protein
MQVVIPLVLSVVYLRTLIVAVCPGESACEKFHRLERKLALVEMLSPN